jgi:hypothetical protein
MALDIGLPMENASLHQDQTFRRIVVASTGLGLACMLASVAAIKVSKTAGLEFIWHWSILVVAAIGLFWNARFWSAVWETQDRPNRGSTRKLLVHVAGLALLGLGSFLYPIRFIEQSYWDGILKGLVTAVTFLGTMIWLIYKVGKGFQEIDSIEMKRQSS